MMMKAFTHLIKSNNSVFVLVLVILSLHSCTYKQRNEESKGYLNSSAYREYLKPEKVDSNYGQNELYNADYSVKRMFTLLGEEGFLYNSEYDVYAVFMYMPNGGLNSIDYYVLKSKDSIYSLSRKRVVDADYFLYVNKLSDDTLYKKQFDLEVTTKLVEKRDIKSACGIFKEAISVVSPEPKYFGSYGGPLRCLYLFYNNNYHFITDHKLTPTVMNKIDSLFRRCLFVK
ncbi:MAG: hypothetical protein EOO44_20140 [Flavobacterium sp.]|nr:MAG: hypothetical protein EOO44_20140 [Flavobacterium sp.]